jgi:hypothetical protein
MFSSLCGHKKIKEKREVRLDRWVLISKCAYCGKFLGKKDDGKYEGTPRPEPPGGWAEEHK